MAFTKLSTNQTEFLVKHLRGTNRVLSAAQAEALYGIKNIRARMSEIRDAGYIVRTGVNTKGYTTYAISRRKIGQV